MKCSAADLAHMARAHQLASKGLYTCMPNPRVGCVLVKNDQVIGEGWHQRAGEAHAEVNALAAARQHGHETKNAIAYVTLEPCCHEGKTGPCTQQLIDAGVQKVFYAMKDPNPQVAGEGLQKLQNAGIETIGPILEASAQTLNAGFIKRMQQGLPYVRLKMAMSVDGRTAMASGESKWITGSAAREDVQSLRARSCAVVTGIETVLKDNAALTVRANELRLAEADANAQRQPLRVVLDSEGRLPDGKRILSPDGPVLLVNASKNNDGKGSEKKVYAEHVECIQMPAAANDGIDLQTLLQELSQRECNEVLVEAGATLAGQFIQQDLVDEIIIYMAPKLLGSTARPLFELPLEAMSSQLDLTITDIRAVGMDWRITATPNVGAC